MSESRKKSMYELAQTLRVLLLGAVVLGLLYAAAVQINQRFYQSQTAELFAPYSSQRTGISLLYPKEWTPQESSNEDVLKVVSFSRPVDTEADPGTQFTGQLLVDVQQASAEDQKVDEETFFSGLDENIETSLGRPEQASPTEEFAELGSREEIEVEGHRALKVIVDITNYDNQAGEVGNGVLVFIYVDESTQVTVLYEGHSSDNDIFESFDQIIRSLDLSQV